MKPVYWLGIMPVVGAVIGTILGFIFPSPGTNYAVYGTVLGMGAGLMLYASQNSKAAKKDH
jgi:zinc transporter ZupT